MTVRIIYMGDIARWHFFLPDRHGCLTGWAAWLGPWLITWGPVN